MASKLPTRWNEADIIAETGSTFIRVEGGARPRDQYYQMWTSAGISQLCKPNFDWERFSKISRVTAAIE